MTITKKELLIIWKAISALETAYSVTLSQEKKVDGFGYWESVEKAQEILEHKLIEGE
jgi:hypothetical protein